MIFKNESRTKPIGIENIVATPYHQVSFKIEKIVAILTTPSIKFPKIFMVSWINICKEKLSN